jgi:hypothetical protein
MTTDPTNSRYSRTSRGLTNKESDPRSEFDRFKFIVHTSNEEKGHEMNETLSYPIKRVSHL